MELFVWVLICIIAFFVLLMGVKEIFKKKFCVLCVAVSLTWFLLLILYWKGLFTNKLIIALLMGSSVLGIFYLVEKKVKESWELFRLPFYLTLVSLVYFVLEGLESLGKVALVLVSLWVVFGFLFVYKNNNQIGSFVKKLIECCKNW